MNLRPATVQDVPALAALEERLFGVDAWSAASVASEVTGPGGQVLVAQSPDGRVVGYAAATTAGDVVDLRRLGVDRAWRRRGVARSLLGALLRAVRESVVRPQRMLLEVSAANHGALTFYAACGFSEVDRRRRYYRDGTDAVVMRLPLGPGCGGRAG